MSPVMLFSVQSAPWITEILEDLDILTSDGRSLRSQFGAMQSIGITAMYAIPSLSARIAELY